MNKEQLIKAIVQETGLSSVDCKKVLEAYIKVVQTALAAGESVQLSGFSTLSVKERAERKGNHPQTRKEITIPASNVVRFSAGSQLKEAVNANKKATKNKK